MNNLSTEKEALAIMRKDNFRGISKDNVMQLMSIINKLEPETAKALIAQFPQVIAGIVTVEQLYNDLLKAGISSIDQSTNSCFDSEDAIIAFLQKEASKDGVSFEEKKFYCEQMEKAVQRKEAKETEHNTLIQNILTVAKGVVIGGVLITAGIVMDKVDIKLPTLRAA